MSSNESKYHSQIKYAKKNLVKLGVDVKPEIRQRFQDACRRNNLKPSAVLKKFISDYIDNNV